MVDIIQKKRDGYELSKQEIDYVINGLLNNEIPDYQITAFLMAVYFRELNEQETIYLTDALIKSGKQIDLSAIPGIKIDKHSTGGVGDKTDHNFDATYGSGRSIYGKNLRQGIRSYRWHDR